jgi:hypothetical protein
MAGNDIQQIGATGREMDALIAEKVMGYSLDYEFADVLGAPTVKELRDKYDEWGLLPNYSTDIADAWQVVDKIYVHSLRRIVNGEPDKPALWQVFIYADSTLSGIAETPALAICRAALMAVSNG